MTTVKQDEIPSDLQSSTTTATTTLSLDNKQQLKPLIPATASIPSRKALFQPATGGTKSSHSNQDEVSAFYHLPPKIEVSLTEQHQHPQHNQLQYQDRAKYLFLVQKQQCIATRNARIWGTKEKWAPVLEQVIRAKEQDCRLINDEFGKQMFFIQEMENQFNRVTVHNDQINSLNHGSIHNHSQSQSGTGSNLKNEPNAITQREPAKWPHPQLAKQEKGHNEVNQDLLQTPMDEDGNESEDESSDYSDNAISANSIMEEYLRNLDVNALEKAPRVGGTGFKCPFQHCGQVLARTYDVKRHIRLKHPENSAERPFACTETGCNKRFTLKHHVKEHVDAVHLKLKPFKCPVCKRAFARNRTITKHCKKAHPEYFNAKIERRSKKATNHNIESRNETEKEECWRRRDCLVLSDDQDIINVRNELRQQ